MATIPGFKSAAWRKFAYSGFQFPLEQRLRDRIRIDPLSGCHLFVGSINHDGYGIIAAQKPSRKRLLAHRAAYELAKGPIPAGLDVDHLCRNRACCNPAHLEAVTHTENMRRAALFLEPRTHCPRGHEYTPGNTRVRTGGGNLCRECAGDRQRRLRARRKANGVRADGKPHGSPY